MRQYKLNLIQKSKELRNNPTSAERTLWLHLRGNQLAGCKFRRQQPIGPFIVDFYSSKLKLAIELDGESHDERIEADARRQKYLGQAGISVLRFLNEDIRNNLEGVIQTIYDFCREREIPLT